MPNGGWAGGHCPRHLQSLSSPLASLACTQPGQMEWCINQYSPVSVQVSTFLSRGQKSGVDDSTPELVSLKTEHCFGHPQPGWLSIGSAV